MAYVWKKFDTIQNEDILYLREKSISLDIRHRCTVDFQLVNTVYFTDDKAVDFHSDKLNNHMTEKLTHNKLNLGNYNDGTCNMWDKPDTSDLACTTQFDGHTILRCSDLTNPDSPIDPWENLGDTFRIIPFCPSFANAPGINQGDGWIYPHPWDTSMATKYQDCPVWGCTNYYEGLLSRGFLD